jgi:hypothetical protein
MIVAVADRVEASSFASHRGDGITFQRLLKGSEGAPDNFELSVVHIDTEYRTPRHRHNFDQVLYVLEGTHEYAPKATMPTGTVTYSPEGTHYGPQVGHGATTLIVQLGGSSGSGFMSYDQLAAGNRELAERGRFENGIFRVVDDTGRSRNQDGYEAIWEHVHGRPVSYPPARYDHPITMWPEHFAWSPSDSEPGVSHRHLATFSERRTAVDFVRLDAGATHRLQPAPGIRLHFVVSGDVTTADGRHGPRTALRIDPGEAPVYEATAETELFALTLPTF